MPIIALDTEDRAAVIDYLHMRNAFLIERDGTICSNPECPTFDHVAIFDQSKVYSYYDAMNGLDPFFSATELKKGAHKLGLFDEIYTWKESDAILFGAGYPIKKSIEYMTGWIAIRSRRSDGTPKPDWLQNEYKLLIRFIKKRTVRYKITSTVCCYLSHSIEEKWKQGEISIFNMGLYKDYILRQEKK